MEEKDDCYFHSEWEMTIVASQMRKEESPTERSITTVETEETQERQSAMVFLHQKTIAPRHVTALWHAIL